MSFADGLVEDLNKIVLDVNLKNNKTAMNIGVKRCYKASKLISTALKNSSSIAEKQHLLTLLARVKSFTAIIKALEVSGFGYKERKETATHRVKWDDLHSAFKCRVRTGTITNLKNTDAKSFLGDCAALLKRRIQNGLKVDNSYKVNAVLCGDFQITKDSLTLNEYKYLNSKTAVIDQNTNFDEWFLENVQDQLLTKLEEFQEKDSGWVLNKLVNLTVSINKYNPLRAGSYIGLPTFIKKKHACINVQNDDNMCFAWAVTSALYPTKCNYNLPSSYPDPKEALNLKGIQFPMTLRQIPRFEQHNYLSINVYRLEKFQNKFNVIPAYLTKTRLEKHVNLLFVEDKYYDTHDDEIDSGIFSAKQHFVWIKDLSRLMSTQLSSHKQKKYICDRCLHFFYSEEKLNKHIQDCEMLNNNGAVPKVPTEERKWVEFKDFKFKEEAPFIIYADTECLLAPVEDVGSKATANYQKHVPYSIGFYVKCSYDDSLSFYKSYTGQDCMQWFVKELVSFAEDVETVFLCDLPMENLSAEQNKILYSSKLCHICEKPFSPDEIMVRDHSHITGKIRGAAHEKCNLNFQDSHTIPVLFHNMSSYDGHLVLKALTEVPGKIDILPVNKEKYISFTKSIPENLVQLRFIDSFRFLASGLDKLASYLSDYPILKSQFMDLSEDKVSLLCRKGVFPYDFMDSWDKLRETKLPSKIQFYNRLNDSLISDKEYAHAHKVWNSLGCKTIQDYSDLYLKTDILLLADIFEQFRNTSFKTYGISPTHAYTLPGYAWQCMLFQMSKTNQVKLELLTDLDMVMFVEKGIRGGLSQCSQRFSVANNKYMPSYDASKDESYLMYFDINNQYGWAMSQYLPYGCFKWLSSEEINSLNVIDVSEEADTGYILEVDLKIPFELHNKFSDLPLCPEHRKPEAANNIKLLATLHDKDKYVIHYRNLKQALALGLQLKKIHRVLSFSQSPWLKPYIDLNTSLRQAAKNEFEKNLFKLMNNAVFGKTMENVRNYSSVKLVMNWEGRYGAEALISKPEFKTCTIINENFVIIELAKSKIYFNKPIYVGMSILDLAKTTIYDFHYNYMLHNFSNCNVLYTDTDSLIYEIRNIDVYQVIRRDCRQYFDTSDYSVDNIYGIPKVNKKVVGIMKDENNGRVMTHFIGLRSKMYATKVQFSSDEIEQERLKLAVAGKQRQEIENYLSKKGVTKKIKGIKKCVIENQITFEDYVKCLETFTDKSVSQNLIRSKNHDLYSVRQSKIGLSPHDDKRQISKSSANTIPWGHYSIMED